MSRRRTSPSDPHAEAVSPGTIDRREAIRRAAIVGGAAVWAVPIVQAVAVRSTHAVSPPPDPRPPSGDSINVAGAGAVAAESQTVLGSPNFTG